ncbi:MAG: GFA family protein [Pseudomonadota bacterium]|nr:GFA family protein [Pseudomonadota bacterium]
MMATHAGGCHCGAVRFEVDAPEVLELSDCNCSICYVVGYQHLKVQKTAFRLLKGEDALSSYQFNSGVAQHFFCKTCGVKSFYVPRSHPDGISVNARCLDAGTFEIGSLMPFEGQQWEKNVNKLGALPD